jgi:hypothetical protein
VAAEAATSGADEVRLSGRLDIGCFNPPPANTYVIIRSNSRTGTFDRMTVSGCGRRPQLRYVGTNVELVFN